MTIFTRILSQFCFSATATVISEDGIIVISEKQKNNYNDNNNPDPGNIVSVTAATVLITQVRHYLAPFLSAAFVVGTTAATFTAPEEQ